ncbi:hypothetical protein EON67_10915 [archaeon]|nr:MAG: hypothetical protein EON67_10915 [archaeon]
MDVAGSGVSARAQSIIDHLARLYVSHARLAAFARPCRASPVWRTQPCARVREVCTAVTSAVGKVQALW